MLGEHDNPYTQRAYKNEPGLAWLALINEGNLANYVSLAKDIPDYREAWNRWLAERYQDRAALATAWGAVLKAEEDPARGTVTLDGPVHSQDLRGRDLVLFLAQVEQDFLVRATAFLREELGVRALVTNMNGWTNHATSQRVRNAMDFVDDHFYVDHPRFLEFAGASAARVGDPYQIAPEKLVELLRQRGILSADNPTDPGANVFQCETGEITIDGLRDRLTLDTPRTAGGFAPAGDSIRTVHGVQIAVQDTDATVWVSSLDDQPIPASRRRDRFAPHLFASSWCIICQRRVQCGGCHIGQHKPRRTAVRIATIQPDHSIVDERDLHSDTNFRHDDTTVALLRSWGGPSKKHIPRERNRFPSPNQ